MLNFSEETINNIFAAILALATTIGLVIGKKKKRITDRRQLTTHELRKQKYISHEAYALSKRDLELICQKVSLANALRERGTDWEDILDELTVFFPGGRVIDYQKNVMHMMEEAERMQDELEDE